MHDEVAVEMQQQVLPARLDALHGPAAQPLGPAIALVPALRRAHLIGHAPLEHRPDHIGGVMNRVALRHLPDDPTCTGSRE